MALIPVYTPKFEKVMMEPVDARECIEHCGYSLEPPKPAENKKAEGENDGDENTPATDTDDEQGPGTGKPASGDPEAGQKVDDKPVKGKK